MKDLYNNINDAFSQPIESEKLEAKFKRMKKKDIAKLRVALSLILPCLMGPADGDTTSEISHYTGLESIGSNA